MSARKGTSFAPTDPESKKAGRSSASSNPYGYFATGEMDKSSASSCPGGKAPVVGQSRVFNSAMQSVGGGKKASTLRASASGSAQPSSLGALPPIPKTGQRQGQYLFVMTQTSPFSANP